MRLRIAEVIRDSRKSKNITQERLAEIIGVSAGYIGQIERDETIPSANVIAKLIEFLGIDANLLFFDNNRSSSLCDEISIRVSRLSEDNQKIVLGLINVIEETYRKENSYENCGL